MIGFRLLLVACLGLIACSVDVGPHGRDVGSPCDANAIPFACDEQCITAVPGGMCSYFCLSDADCPNGTACIDQLLTVGSYMCAQVCADNAGCAEYGRGISCVSRGRIGTPGKISVCYIPSAF